MGDIDKYHRKNYPDSTGSSHRFGTQDQTRRYISLPWLHDEHKHRRHVITTVDCKYTHVRLAIGSILKPEMNVLFERDLFLFLIAEIAGRAEDAAMFPLFSV